MPNSQNADSSDEVPTPRLVKAKQPIPDRRVLMLVIVIPYVLAVLAAFTAVLCSDLDEARITLASSVFLGPLGALAGVIVAFYFKSTD